MLHVSQKIFFSAENVLGALSSDVLQNKELPRSISTVDPAFLGRGSYNILAVELSGLHTKINSITATLSENYSNTRKNSNPISQLLLFTTNSDTMYFAGNVKSDLFEQSSFTFNGIPVLNKNDLSEFSLNGNNTANTPKNIISFKAVPDLATNEHYLHFFPKYTLGKLSTIDTLDRIYWFSFYDQFVLNVPIKLPSQAKYLLIMPYVTLPVVPSKLSVASANIYTSYFINLELGED